MNAIVDFFSSAAKAWAGDQYFLTVAYMFDADLGEIWGLRAEFAPLKGARGLFEETYLNVNAGFVEFGPLASVEICEIIDKLVTGKVEVGRLQASLTKVVRASSDFSDRSRWFQPLVLRLEGTPSRNFDVIELNRLDAALRCGNPPFDGLAELCSWLGFSESELLLGKSQLKISVLPPVDLNIGPKRAMENGRLQVQFRAHRSLRVEDVQFGVRWLPGDASARVQISDQIEWEPLGDEPVRTGALDVRVVEVETSSVLTLLSAHGITVRRHWFVDEGRAPNIYHSLVAQYDKDLRRLRAALFDGDDAKRFETAVANLAFILGFTPALSIETDAPDIVLIAPSGRVVLIECTLRLADVHAKAGKLADRRMLLESRLREAGDFRDVSAALVVRQSRSNPAIAVSDVRKKGVFLIAKEDLDQFMIRASLPANADAILNEISDGTITS